MPCETPERVDVVKEARLRLKRRRRIPQPSTAQAPSNWLSKCDAQPCGAPSVALDDGIAHGGLTPPAADDDASPVAMPAPRPSGAKRVVQRKGGAGRPRSLRLAARRSDIHGAPSPVRPTTVVKSAARSSAARQPPSPTVAEIHEPDDAPCDRAGKLVSGRGLKRDISPQKRDVSPPVAKSLRSSGRPRVDPEQVADQDHTHVGVATDEVTVPAPDVPGPPVLAPAIFASGAHTPAVPPVARVWKLRSPAGLVGA